MERNFKSFNLTKTNVLHSNPFCNTVASFMLLSSVCTQLSKREEMHLPTTELDFYTVYNYIEVLICSQYTLLILQALLVKHWQIVKALL